LNLLLVILGGGIGAGGRYLLGGWLHSLVGYGFPWGTFTVNVLGSLVLGMVFGLAQQGLLSSGTIVFLTVGVLGGFTTFSSFSFETMRLLALGNVGASLLNVAGQFATSLLAVYLGFTLLRGLG
jgi:CrcB protein